MPSRGGRGSRGSRGHRGSSGAWGRLKPVEQDPLQSMGLPSKGDTRLLDFKAQEKYYTKIIERYLTFCTDAGQRDEILRGFSSVGDSVKAQTLKESTPAAVSVPADNQALADVIMAMRKLREGVVASKRADEFAVQVYLFCIRVSIMAKQPEAYHPAMLHLLRRIHPQHPLTTLELQEVVGLLVLDTACRRGQLAEAFEIRRQYQLKDAKINIVLRALVHDNYVAFGRARRDVDGHSARIMEYAEKDMRAQTLKCFGRTYLSVDLGFLEKTAESTWGNLTHEEGVGWELDAGRVIADDAHNYVNGLANSGRVRMAEIRFGIAALSQLSTGGDSDGAGCTTCSNTCPRSSSTAPAFLPTSTSLYLTAFASPFLLLHSNNVERPCAAPTMPPARKKAKTTNDRPSLLLSDYRTAWVVSSSQENTVELRVADEVFKVHRCVLTQHSEYFEACLKQHFAEADGIVRFEDIEPKYLAFFIGVAYSYSSIVPHTPPVASEHPEARGAQTPLRDFVEVYKLCDRFICTSMAEFMTRCIHTGIGDNHRALFRSAFDKNQQKFLMRDFADAYEALNPDHKPQQVLRDLIVDYFCDGVNFSVWDECMTDVLDCPNFVAHVSRGFAKRLHVVQTANRKMKRKERTGPGP
ncbi:hypothetical protein S7711_08983 [Stachybotrys chartarum IBT 7711]|uniref:BTB domain-containing protein n=1 Tax=Stachybotrys chartarum (strain CBS 109288 / IBT 7711) TaxID=1280523 RepID=A0A084AX14_STACB|nr:hypothetical protein S7711_08983 [Stachybotrys chartarum IBT 7711]KFA47632.1 hypothetical protein S40293_07664 [Stachybotrys chartarum IBT 40293]